MRELIANMKFKTKVIVLSGALLVPAILGLSGLFAYGR